ncbi:TPA: hypothetical protein IV061_002945 [Enterococcus faecium]|nr:hypothetical protein [Enterococcus faecium]
MKTVEPIRDKKKIDAMKAILASGKYGQRNLVLFSIGINTAYRISDLRQLKLADVLEISRGRVVVKDRLAMKEQKTAKHNSVYISNKLRKTFGYFLYKQGTKTEIIQSLLNHSSQRETLRYIGITQEDKDTAVKSLDL